MVTTLPDENPKAGWLLRRRREAKNKDDKGAFFFLQTFLESRDATTRSLRVVVRGDLLQSLRPFLSSQVAANLASALSMDWSLFGGVNLLERDCGSSEVSVPPHRKRVARLRVFEELMLRAVKQNLEIGLVNAHSAGLHLLETLEIKRSIVLGVAADCS